ncbi:MAG TPA: hypothetical protein VG076_14395 [Acidimicrobiales bacterium]|nr:hypothetical protein [Acidimicrobiales bacterium]
MFRRPRGDSLPAGREPMAAWHQWVSDGMQQHERGLSPFDDSRPSALILVPLLGLPALLIVGVVLIFLLG